MRILMIYAFHKSLGNVFSLLQILFQLAETLASLGSARRQLEYSLFSGFCLYYLIFDILYAKCQKSCFPRAPARRRHAGRAKQDFFTYIDIFCPVK